MTKYVTTREASKILGVHYQTLRSWDRKGKIKTIRTPGGHRLYDVNSCLNPPSDDTIRRYICYCRVSSNSQKPELENQISYMKEHYPTYEILYDIGSEINFKRPNLQKIISYAIDGEIEEVVVAYKDRLCRIAYELIENVIQDYSNGQITIINKEETGSDKELVDDMIEIVTVFSSKIYGMRSYKSSKN